MWWFVRGFERAEHATADLMVRVYGSRDELLSESRTLFNAPPEATVNIVLASPNGRLSEYVRVLTTVTPLLEGVPLGELTDADVRFLAGDTRIEASRIRTLTDAIKFGAENRLPAEAVTAGGGWTIRSSSPSCSVTRLGSCGMRSCGALDEPEPGIGTTPVVGRLVSEREGVPPAGFTVHKEDCRGHSTVWRHVAGGPAGSARRTGPAHAD